MEKAPIPPLPLGDGGGWLAVNWKGWALKIKTFLGPEMATSETHVPNITNVPVYGAWTLKIETFLGP